MTSIAKIKTITDINCSVCPSITCNITSLYKERIEYLEKLVKKYKFDYLTGLMGKADYLEKMDRLFEEYNLADQEFYFGIIDINNLHNINKIKGYQYGDEVIRKTALKLKELFQFHQVFRIGGDEFVILIRSYQSSIEEVIKKLECVENISFIVENIKHYENPKHMFKILDSKLTENKIKEKRI